MTTPRKKARGPVSAKPRYMNAVWADWRKMKNKITFGSDAFGISHKWSDSTPIYRMEYAWISEGGYTVYVADIKDDEDEKAIRDQIYAEGMGWMK